MRQRLPSPYGQRIDRNRPVSAQFDGRDLPAFDGDSVASAIVASGQWVVSRSFKYHRPRGPLTFAGHDEAGTAYLTMGGGCHGCSMSKVTMLEGVQTTLVEKVEGIQRVRDMTDHQSGENPFYR